jgi:hypothetical protein
MYLCKVNKAQNYKKKRKMESINYIKLGSARIGYGFTGSASVWVAVQGDKLGFLPNENTPYMPLGGRKSLKSVAHLLIFK